MRKGDTDASAVKLSGWRQGCVLRPSLVQKLIKDGVIPFVTGCRRQTRPYFLRLVMNCTKALLKRRKNISSQDSDSDLWVVVSHDCDVTNADLRSEPYVELLRLRPNNKKKGELHWGKNPRQYQLSDRLAGRSQLFDVEIHDLVRVPRAYLLDSTPDINRTIKKKNIQRIARWIAQRYVRATFPDAFNKRTCHTTKRLHKKFKQDGHLITGIYILVSDEELNPEQEYKVNVYALMRPEDYENPTLRTKAQRLLDHVDAEFATCDGIRVDVTEIRSEAEFSVNDAILMKRWDFDDLSIRDSLDGPLVREP